MIKKATRTLARCESLLGRQSITNDFERVALRGLPKPYSGTMVARDGVERFCVQSFQQLADSTKDRKDTEDRKDTSCVRFVCDFSLRRPAQLAAAEPGDNCGSSVPRPFDHEPNVGHRANQVRRWPQRRQVAQPPRAVIVFGRGLDELSSAQYQVQSISLCCQGSAFVGARSTIEDPLAVPHRC
jgi:hypothetical protein